MATGKQQDAGVRTLYQDQKNVHPPRNRAQARPITPTPSYDAADYPTFLGDSPPKKES